VVDRQYTLWNTECSPSHHVDIEVANVNSVSSYGDDEFPSNELRITRMID
jgi:hypothetical protein